MVEPNDLKNIEMLRWLRSDVDKLFAATEKLYGSVTALEGMVDQLRATLVGHQHPCNDLRKHLSDHRAARDRWWSVWVRLASSALIGASAALLTMWKKLG